MKAMQVLVIPFLLTLYASLSEAQIGDYIGYPVLVVDQQSEEPDVFYDVFAEPSGLGESFSQAPSPQNFGWIGACLRLDRQPCIHSADGRTSIIEAFYRTLGRRTRGRGIDLSGVPAGLFEISTTWEPADEGILATVSKTIDNRRYRGSFLLKKEGGLSQRKVVLSFPSRDQSERGPIDDQTASHKELAAAVVQIASGPIDSKNLLGRIVKSGTGFFISSDGLMLTNHHVISSYPECIRKLRCELNIRRKLSEDSDIESPVQAVLLAHDESYDFALLKLDLPFVPGVIEIEEKQIGPKLLTLGYPGDLKDSRGKVDLTFSHGFLAGFKARSFSTTNYVYPGASGSPLLNENNLKVIGIVSDVQGNPEAGSGNPALARPLDIIDDDFGLRAYVSGEKQRRINKLLGQLKGTESRKRARGLLRLYRQENSLYRVGQLQELMISHSVVEVRRMIFNTLYQLGLVRGEI